MPRRTRCILPGVPCHVTQRGVDRRTTFLEDANRLTYLQLLRQNLADAAVRPSMACGPIIFRFCWCPISGPPAAAGGPDVGRTGLLGTDGKYPVNLPFWFTRPVMALTSCTCVVYTYASCSYSDFRIGGSGRKRRVGWRLRFRAL